MSYSTLDFRFLIPRGHHCDRRVVNGIVFRTTAIFYLPTTHERRREEAVSRHERSWTRVAGGEVRESSRTNGLSFISPDSDSCLPAVSYYLYIYIKGACPRFKQSPTYLIFAFQACQCAGTKRQKFKSSSFLFREI